MFYILLAWHTNIHTSFYQSNLFLLVWCKMHHFFKYFSNASFLLSFCVLPLGRYFEWEAHVFSNLFLLLNLINLVSFIFNYCGALFFFRKCDPHKNLMAKLLIFFSRSKLKICKCFYIIFFGVPSIKKVVNNLYTFYETKFTQLTG